MVAVHTPIDNCKTPVFQGSGNIRATPCDIGYWCPRSPRLSPSRPTPAAAILDRFSSDSVRQKLPIARRQPPTNVNRGVNGYLPTAADRAGRPDLAGHDALGQRRGRRL